MKVKVITDSANDLPKKIIDFYNIQYASLTVTFDDEVTFNDGKDLSRDEFYFRLIEAKQLPKTSQPSPQAFYELMEEALAQDLEVVVITLSSALSGTYNSALMAKNMFPEEKQQKIHIIDSLAASMGQGLLVLAAAKMAQDDMSGDEITKNIYTLRSKLRCIFTVDTFEYLLRGGRITKVQAVLGTMLDIKPLMKVTPEGTLAVFEKVRGKKKAFTRLMDVMAEMGKDLSSQTVGIVHTRAPEEANTWAQKIRELYNVKDIIIAEMSATIGTHTGPGCIGIFFYGE
mgnify:CR=1 FL=1